MITVPRIRQSRVQEIIDTAQGNVVSYWITIAEAGVERFPRQLVYLEPDDRGEVHFNVGEIVFGPWHSERRMTADMTLLAKSKDGPVVKSCPLTNNGRSSAPVLGYCDSLKMHRGDFRIAGQLP